MGSQLPDQGSNPCPLNWQYRVSTTRGVPRVQVLMQENSRILAKSFHFSRSPFSSPFMKGKKFRRCNFSALKFCEMKYLYTTEIAKEVPSSAIWVACLVAQEIFIFIFMGTRRTKSFHVDALGEDQIPFSFSITLSQWFVSPGKMFFNGIVLLIKVS